MSGINQSFTSLENWQFQSFNSQVGIINPVSKAYIVELGTSNGKDKWRLEDLEALLNHSHAKEIEALICRFGYDYKNNDRNFGVSLEALCDVSRNLSNLKALYIGGSEEHEYRKSKLHVFDIRPILEAFPKLQVLQVRGRFDEFILECQSLQHDHLKTLIIETADLNNQNLEQICNLRLPALEYFELWLGRQLYHITSLDSLTPVLAAQSFPNLSYLGLRSCDFADSLAETITQSPIIKQLTRLNLSMGNLTDDGAEILLNCPEINQLHTLDISMNQLSGAMIQKLHELNYQIIAEPQDSDYGYRYFALHE